MKKTALFAALTIFTYTLQAQDLADLFEKNKESVVTIYVAESVSQGTGDPLTFTANMGLGSGVLVREDVILTAAHVVANAEEIIVQFFDGESIAAKTFRISRMADVALIQLDKPPANPHVAIIGNSDEERIGNEIFVIGAPMGLPYSLSRGVIKGIGFAGFKGGFRMLMIDEQEILLGGDIILQVDDIRITGEESVIKILKYLNLAQSSVTHKIKVLRAGEAIELAWVSSDFQPSRR